MPGSGGMKPAERFVSSSTCTIRGQEQIETYLNWLKGQRWAQGSSGERRVGGTWTEQHQSSPGPVSRASCVWNP